ncbi:MAG: sel1 repeat family protein [Gammaproteobacteria bacterium]|nr:sel1 repeat family protein [Gammaproteobacteria bacterium]
MSKQGLFDSNHRTAGVRSNSIAHWIVFALILVFIFFSHRVNALSGAVEQSRHASINIDGANQLGYKGQERMMQLVHGLQAFANEDYALAHRILLPLAKTNVVEAQFYIGMMYDTGLGVERDLAAAFGWYQFAAYEGHSSAQHNLAVAYANGEGVDVDSNKAVYWWKQAANQGNADAQYNLGIVYAVGKLGIKPNLDKAKNWWRKAAMNGDGMAQYNLGILYASAKNEVRSYCEAARWWEQSVNNGVQQAGVALEVLKNRKDYYTCW